MKSPMSVRNFSAPIAAPLVEVGRTRALHVGRLQGRVPDQGHVVLGTGEAVAIPLHDVMALHRHAMARLETAVGNGHATYPEPVAHCAICDFSVHCFKQRLADDHLSLVAQIRRVTGAFDSRLVRVIPIAAPTEEERMHPYLWRFWRQLPRHGNVAVFDRSWYGRVLVERVEGFATNKEWRRAYREINEFERMLVDSGIRLVKLFLHITPDEQVRRFRDRLIDPVKRWKLSYEDFRNHTRWSDYETAIEDMMEKTATKHAPWHLIPANNKPYGRIVAFRILADRLGKDVSLDPRPIDPDLLKEAKRTLSLSASDIERASHPAKRKVKLKRNHPEI